MPERLPRSFTPQQVADYLEVSVDTIYRWRKEGRLAGFQLPGGGWRFLEADIRALFPEPKEVAS